MTTLKLEGCNIGDEGAICLGNSLEDYECKLQLLDISRNLITFVGAERIGYGLAANKNLKVIFMHWNNIGPLGGFYIADSLIQNNSLLVLDVSFCGMGGKKIKNNPNQMDSLSKDQRLKLAESQFKAAMKNTLLQNE